MQDLTPALMDPSADDPGADPGALTPAPRDPGAPGAQKAQPFGHPLDGRVRPHSLLDSMEGAGRQDFGGH